VKAPESCFPGLLLCDQVDDVGDGAESPPCSAPDASDIGSGIATAARFLFVFVAAFLFAGAFFLAAFFTALRPLEGAALRVIFLFLVADARAVLRLVLLRAAFRFFAFAILFSVELNASPADTRGSERANEC